MPQNDERGRMIEENMGLVGKVLKDKVRDIHNIGIYTYEDLFQIGCVGLCKAADTYRPEGGGKFSTYAYILIRNEIFDALKYATLRRNRETVIDMNKWAPGTLTASAYRFMDETELALDAAWARVSGVTAKGIEAIRLLAQGYTHREIGERMGGVSANNVSAWVARARKFLRSDQTTKDLGDAI